MNDRLVTVAIGSLSQAVVNLSCFPPGNSKALKRVPTRMNHQTGAVLNLFDLAEAVRGGLSLPAAMSSPYD
jgi:hypothetical protein